MFGQTNINIDIKNYESDSLLIGYYLAEKMLVYDTLIKNDESSFAITQDTAMDPGMYMIVSMPEGMFYQFLVNDDQEFQIDIDTLQEEQITITGETENAVFYDYMRFVEGQRKQQEQIDLALSTTDSTQISIQDQLLKDKAMLSGMVAQKQNQIISDYPESIVAILLKANLPVNWPEYTGTEEEVQQQKYLYYKAHYFDNVDLSHPAILKTPIVHQRVTYYEESLTPTVPDSIITSLDYLLGLMPEDSEIFRYYLSYWLGKYANSKYIGMDAVYVHLALNYYAKGKAPWVTEENKNEIVDQARRIQPTLIGKTAPDFTLYDKNNEQIILSERNNPYTVVVFWKPSCGHCEKAMPHIVEFEENYRKYGVEVITVCTENAKKVDDCWKSIEEKNMQNLTNGIDLNGRDRTQAKYYATSTPMIYLIDDDQKIKLKKLPAENLGAVMDQVIKEDGAQAIEGQ